MKGLGGKVSDELLNGPSFVEAGKTSKVFRLGLGQSGSTADEGDFSDSSPYEGQDEEVEAGRR